MIERWMNGSPAARLGKPVMKWIPDMHKETEVILIMEVKAPRGEMMLFRGRSKYADSQAEAIKAFMEEHKNDWTDQDTNATG